MSKVHTPPDGVKTYRYHCVRAELSTFPEQQLRGGGPVRISGRRSRAQLHRTHRKEQARIVRVALDLEEDVLKPDLSAERPKL